MIDGVVITPLKKIVDERGAVMHMLRSDSDVFAAFGEIYFSRIRPGVVKAWHFHKHMTINYAVPCGQIKFVLFDSRENSKTKGTVQEIDLGEKNYRLITVPPRIWNGFCCIGDEMALVANCTTLPHHPDESEKCDPDDLKIPYTWLMPSS